MFPTIQITPTLLLPTYYLVIILSICISIYWLMKRVGRTSLQRHIALDLSLIIMIFGFLGARIFHVLYEEPLYYFESPSKIFEFWNGGFVYFGGSIFALFAAFIYFNFKKTRGQARYLDLFAPLISFTYLVGRVGCWLAGCCYGKTCELPWAISGRHPTQLYAFTWELGVLIIILALEKIPFRDRKPRFLAQHGCLFYLWLILHGFGRILMESFRDDFRGAQWGLSISSWISYVFIALGIFLLLRKPVSK